MFAGGGLTSFRDVVNVNCGTTQTCSGDASPYSYSFGATYWITRYLGVEGSFLHPQKIKISGGDGFTFNTEVNMDIWNILGKAGVQAGPVRLYGQGGMSYHQATHVTNQTIGEASQRFEVQTEGWNYVFGGGAEIWVKPRVALFGELDFAQVKGKATDESELVDDAPSRSSPESASTSGGDVPESGLLAARRLRPARRRTPASRTAGSSCCATRHTPATTARRRVARRRPSCRSRRDRTPGSPVRCQA